MNASPGQLCAILQICQDIRQFYVGFVQYDRGGSFGFRRFNSGFAYGDIGLPPLQAGLGYTRRVFERSDAILNEVFIIKLDSISGFVFDPIPKLLELRAMKNGLSWAYLAP